MTRHGLSAHLDQLLAQCWLGSTRGMGAGLRVTLMGSMDVHGDVRGGRPVWRLPEWSFRGLDIWAATSLHNAHPAKVRQAIAALADYLRALPAIVDSAEKAQSARPICAQR